MRSVSVNWKATVKHGFRLASGSWKIIAMSLPTSARRCASESARRSRPAKARRRARTRPGNSTRPISASAVTLLPDPDSPTQPTTSPTSSVRSIPSTAMTGAASAPNSTRRSSISTRAMRLLSLELWIERVAQPVAHEIESEHGDENRETRESHHPGRALDELERVGEHRAPLGRRRLRPQAEEAQRGGVEDRDRDETDQERQPRAVDQPRQDVASNGIGAEDEIAAASRLPDRRR